NIQSLLMMACRYGHAEVVRMLLSAGAHVNDQHENGESSLMMACWYGHAEVVKMLLSAGAHINDQNMARTICSDTNWVLIFTLFSRSVHVHECTHLCTHIVMYTACTPYICHTYSTYTYSTLALLQKWNLVHNTYIHVHVHSCTVHL
ncbi:hypothetical protein EMCRGX_G005818, partial [Ephydatia muelleri]